ncbi:hypothetical protein J6590_003616 [Homalodisca vitripennis]|nr:hypothetical protein J6590_003616 [Homalodisca vitripennis]
MVDLYGRAETPTSIERESGTTSGRQHLPSQVGVRLINKLPECIKLTDNLNHTRAQLKRHLMANEFHSVDEFVESRWDN